MLLLLREYLAIIVVAGFVDCTIVSEEDRETPMN